jgi:hypothetical protein
VGPAGAETKPPRTADFEAIESLAVFAILGSSKRFSLTRLVLRTGELCHLGRKGPSAVDRRGLPYSSKV